MGSGNGIRRNPALRAEIARRFALPLLVPRLREEAALGAALCAAVGLGALPGYRPGGGADRIRNGARRMTVNRPIRVSPSLMCADFLHLGRQLEVMAQQKVDCLHVDVMDGHYVPNFAFGPDFCRALAAGCPVPLDIHLMIEDPDAFVPEFAGLPGATVSFHPETSRHPLRTVELIRASGARAGIVLDPALPVQSARHLLPAVDQVCVLTVNPGYAGQKLVPRTLEKIRELAAALAAEGSLRGRSKWTATSAGRTSPG